MAGRHGSDAGGDAASASFDTGSYFDLFALIVNPNDDAAEVEGTYLLPSSAFTKAYTVAGRSRFNIWADVDDPRLADTAVSMAVVFDDGTTAVQTYPVAAASRFNVPMGVFFPATVGRRFGVVAERLPTDSGVAQIVVERASYNDAVQNGHVVRWAAGANAFGTKLR